MNFVEIYAHSVATPHMGRVIHNEVEKVHFIIESDLDEITSGEMVITSGEAKFNQTRIQFGGVGDPLDGKNASNCNSLVVSVARDVLGFIGLGKILEIEIHRDLEQLGLAHRESVAGDHDGPMVLVLAPVPS